VKRFKADLHIHTALSPCAMDDMTPPSIVMEAVRNGLDMIAICDHNAAGNTVTTQQAAAGIITSLAGIEVTTVEDIHILGLFPGPQEATAVADVVRKNLPELDKHKKNMGEQILMDAEGWTIGTDTKMLAASSDLTLSQTVNLIRSCGGLAVAAHVNRPSFSVISQLGMFPIDADFDAVELFCAGGSASSLAEQHQYGLPILCSSDSHFLSDIGSCSTIFEMEESNFKELSLAIKGIAGRRCLYA